MAEIQEIYEDITANGKSFKKLLFVDTCVAGSRDDLLLANSFTPGQLAGFQVIIIHLKNNNNNILKQ